LQLIRSKLFDAYLVVWTALFAPAMLVLWLARKPGRPMRWATRVWSRGILLGLQHIVGLRYVERGRELRPDKPCLIVANHQSEWETIAFLVLVPNVAIVAKQELLAVPIVGWFLRHSPMILIDRERGSNAIRVMLEESRAALAAGRSVLIFPEGERRGTDVAVEFKRGIEILYSKLDAPVLPVAVNSGHFWGAGLPYKRAGTITVAYLDPIPPGLPSRDFARRAEGQLQAALASG
jgi:1-acyl-sn-glycerol-3-phosphate acyltransferase